MATNKKPLYQNVDGLTICEMFSPDCVREALQYKAQADDLFVVTYPKCGTTWTQTILINILRKGVPKKSFHDFHDICPFLELVGVETLKSETKPRPMKTHFPFNLQPYSPDAKYIYVARNPKDCCVSFYHHTRLFPGYDFIDGSFDDFFELFIHGEVDYGDYFDHILSWYEHRNDPNVLFLTYEDMKKDTKSAVMRIAKFVGKEYEDMLKEDPTVMDNILHYSSFKYMKDEVNSAVSSLGEKVSDEEIDKLPFPKGIKYMMKFINKLNITKKSSQGGFVRKGIVGDWRNYFSLQQSEQVDKRFSQTLANTELDDLWRECMAFNGEKV